MLGAAAMLETSPGHELARSILQRFPDDHLALLAAARRPEWRWFEIVLAYDNARLPQALVVAGQALGRQDLIDCGLETLDWIVAKQTSPEGRFRAVGTESFHRPYADPLQFDQQPLEAQATRAGLPRRSGRMAGIWATTTSTCRWRRRRTAAVSMV